MNYVATVKETHTCCNSKDILGLSRGIPFGCGLVDPKWRYVWTILNGNESVGLVIDSKLANTIHGSKHGGLCVKELQQGRYSLSVTLPEKTKHHLLTRSFVDRVRVAWRAVTPGR